MAIHNCNKNVKNFYTNTKITPLDDISSKDKKAIQLAIKQAKQSRFMSSKKLASVLMVKGQCILWGEST
jgi:hypothetical protein